MALYWDVVVSPAVHYEVRHPWLTTRPLLGSDWVGTLNQGALVTQPMMQRLPNQTELRSMDSYIQILHKT